MIGLLAPLGLAALAAIAVPIVVHLLRGANEREIAFAALRWLTDAERPRTRVRLQERVLLALRLGLVAALALLLALPVWRSAGEPGAPWVVVAPGVSLDAARAAAGVATSAQWRWLAPGFPSVDTPAPEPGAPLSLVRELDATLPDSVALTIVVPRELGDLDAERPTLAHAVDWRVVDGRYPASAARSGETPPPHVAVRYAAADDPQVAVVEAIANAWHANGFDATLESAAADAPVPADADWLFWLAAAPLPVDVERWIAQGGVVLATARAADANAAVVISDDDGEPVVHERVVGSGRLLTTDVALRPDALPALLSPALPRRLREALNGAPPAPDSALASAVAPAHEAERARGTTRPLDTAVALFASLVFLVERLLATRRRGEAKRGHSSFPSAADALRSSSWK
jgi:hypothetical protein